MRGVVVCDVRGMPSSLQERAREQLPSFRAFHAAALRVPLSSVPEAARRRALPEGERGAEAYALPAEEEEMMHALRRERGSALPVVMWATVEEADEGGGEEEEGGGWKTARRADALVGKAMRVEGWSVVLTSRRLRARPGLPPWHRRNVESFLLVRPARGVRLPPPLPSRVDLDSALSATVGALLGRAGRDALHASSCITCCLCPSAALDAQRADDGGGEETGGNEEGGEEWWAARRMWVRVAVPRPDRRSDAAVVFRFGMRDLHGGGGQWDSLTEPEKSRAVEATPPLLPPSDCSICIFDSAEDAGEARDMLARPGLSSLSSTLIEEARKACEEAWKGEGRAEGERGGGGGRGAMPNGMWLRAPVECRAEAARMGAEDVRAWLPSSVRARAPFPLPPACTVFVPVRRSSSSFSSFSSSSHFSNTATLPSPCPHLGALPPRGWEATGEEATYACADRIVHAVVVAEDAAPPAFLSLPPPSTTATASRATTSHVRGRVRDARGRRGGGN